MNDVFDPNAARLRVAEAMKSGSREMLKTELRAFAFDHTQPRVEREAARTQLDVMTEEDSPGSHSRVIGCDGISRAPLPKPSEAVLAKRAELRQKQEALPEHAPRRVREALAQEIAKTYAR